MSKLILDVGIDLGTTNSECYVSCNGSEPELLEMEEGDRFKPAMLASIVMYDKMKDSFVVGNSLKNVDKFLKSWKFMKIHLKDNDKYDCNGNKSNSDFPDSITPARFSEEVLRTIKRNIDDYYEDNSIRNLVITVPAYFKDFERRLVIDAAGKAGLKATNKFELINEPTSAALAYGQLLDEDQNIVAFDLGGGTFDVTLLEYQKIDENLKFYQAIATDGKEIGGKNFDLAIVNLIYKNFIKNEGKIYENNNAFAQAFNRGFLFEAEKIKITLSNMDEASGSIYINYNEQKILVKYRINNDDFHSAIDSYISQIISMTKNVIGANETNKLILVGGSTRMPYISLKLKEAFPKIKLVGNDPDLIVALGACIHAKALSAEESESSIILNEITSNSIGISIVGDFNSKIVFANTPIPYTVTKRYYGTSAGQTSAVSYVVVGNDYFVESPNNQIIGKFEINGMKKLDSVPAIDVTITVNNDSTIDIKAVEVGENGKEVFDRFDLNKHESDFDPNKLRDEAVEKIDDLSSSSVDEICSTIESLLDSIISNSDDQDELELAKYCLKELELTKKNKDSDEFKVLLFRLALKYHD